MYQLIACPECKKHLQVPEDLMGKRVQCPECKHTFTAKAPEEDEESSKTGTTTSKPAPSKTPEWDKKSSSSSNRSGSGKRKRIDDGDDDDNDDDDDRPRHRKRRRSSSYRGNYVPPRGGMILAFGLIGLIGGFVIPLVPVVFGIIAWVMGNADMAEIRAGRMDPEGEGMTQAGRIMGMISTILAI